jgi:hypothetical protein
MGSYQFGQAINFNKPSTSSSEQISSSKSATGGARPKLTSRRFPLIFDPDLSQVCHLTTRADSSTYLQSRNPQPSSILSLAPWLYRHPIGRTSISPLGLYSIPYWRNKIRWGNTNPTRSPIYRERARGQSGSRAILKMKHLNPKPLYLRVKWQVLKRYRRRSM